MSRTLVYVGTYTSPIMFGTGEILEGKGEGIYLCELDLVTGELNLLQTVYGVKNPSYLVLNRKNHCLYAVNELKEFQGQVSGAVSAFRVAEDGFLTYLNTQPTGGTDPCYVETGRDGHRIYVCNFMSGSVSVFPLQPDGSLAAYDQFIQHMGRSVHPKRQTGPHPHSIILSPDGEYVLVPDLGLDRVVIYPVNRETGLLDEESVGFFSVPPGAGPRHGVFSADGRFLYLINELDSTIMVLAYQKGTLVAKQIVPSLPPGAEKENNICADVHLTPNGRYLYGSNRGHDSLVCYRVNPETGLLSYVDCQSSGGKTPRNFAIEPTGRYLLCANQDSDNIVVFAIDYATGKLKAVAETRIPTPVCVRPYLF